MYVETPGCSVNAIDTLCTNLDKSPVNVFTMEIITNIRSEEIILSQIIKAIKVIE